MAERLKFKGKYIKKKVLKKKLECYSLMARGRKSQSKEDKKSEEPNLPLCDIYTGRRIVDFGILAKSLRCSKCKQKLDLDKIENEKRVGLHSILGIMCSGCSGINFVPTGKIHKTQDNRNHCDVNTRAVLGTVHAGMGCTAMNKFLTTVDIPNMTSDLFKQYEREVGPAIEATARNSCKQAATVEKQLMMEAKAKLCSDLPSEVANELFPSKKTSFSMTECLLNDSLSTSTVQNSGEDSREPTNIIASYDMGWSRRGNGRSYDSLNGYGSLIGILSGKIIDFATRNRKCRICDMGKKKEQHDCRKNFEGSAKAMEPDVGAALVNESTILEESGVSVRVLVGDEDSATIAKVRQGACKSIFKFADSNHLRKNFASELYKLQSNFSEMKKKGVIAHLTKCFGYAIAKNKGKSAELASNLREIPNHVFGFHENCGEWCYRKTFTNSTPQTILLRDAGLHTELEKVFFKYANNSSKFSIAASSQPNESLNNIMARKAPKNNCYSLSESADYRFASAICTKNEGDKHLIDVTSKLNLSPGKYMQKFVEQKDKERFRRATIAKLPRSKCRRNILRKNRENLRKKKEQREGIQYKSNCGLEIDTKNMQEIPDSIDSQTLAEFALAKERFKDVSDINIIYFDLETSGFERNAEILEIAAKFDGYIFHVYVTPTQNIKPCASKITGLHQINGVLYLRDRQLDSILLSDALCSFQQFLNLSSKPCLLVAHNAPFDARHLVRAILKSSQLDDFKSIIGFADTLSVLKKIYPQRKGPGMFKLGKLAEDILKMHGNFHEALFDVHVLQKLSIKCIPQEKLLQSTKSFIDYALYEINCEKGQKILPSLKDLKRIVSENMLKKIANAGIDFQMILEASHKHRGVIELLSERNETNVPRVTKDKKTLEKISKFFANYQ